jgi:hypothetical protein
MRYVLHEADLWADCAMWVLVPAGSGTDSRTVAVDCQRANGTDVHVLVSLTESPARFLVQFSGHDSRGYR